jgi:hypothetical protein
MDTNALMNPAFLFGAGMIQGNRRGQPVGQANPLGMGLQGMMAGVNYQNSVEDRAQKKLVDDMNMKLQQMKIKEYEKQLATQEAMAKAYSGGGTPQQNTPQQIPATPYQPTELQGAGIVGVNAPMPMNPAALPQMQGNQAPTANQGGSAYEQSLQQQLALAQKLMSSGDAGAVMKGREMQLDALEKINKQKNQLQWENLSVDPQTGKQFGFHKQSEKTLYTDGTPYIGKPAGYLPESVVNQKLRIKEEEKKINDSGWRDEEYMQDGIAYTQPVKYDSNGNVVARRNPMPTNVPQNYKVDGLGMSAIKGTPADMSNPKNWSESMKKDTAFANAMVQAEAGIHESGNDKLVPSNQLKAYILALGETGTIAQGKQMLYGRGLSSEEKQYAQQAMQFIRAKLRKDSGATIGENESAGEFTTFFPSPNADEKEIANKARARMMAIRGVQRGAGEAYQFDDSLRSMGVLQYGFDEDGNKTDNWLEIMKTKPVGTLFLDDDGLYYRIKPAKAK